MTGGLFGIPACGACGQPMAMCACTLWCAICGYWTNHTTEMHAASEDPEREP